MLCSEEVSELSGVQSRHGSPQADAHDAVERALALHSRGRAAATSYRFPESIRLLRRGLSVLEAWPATTAVREARIRLLSTLAVCLAETSGLRDGLAVIDSLHAEMTDFPAGPVRDELSGLADHNQAVLLCRVGRMAEGVEFFDSAIAHTERLFFRSPSKSSEVAGWLATQLTNRANARSALGDLQPAQQDLERAVALATRAGLPITAGLAEKALGNVLQRAGDLPGALRAYTRARAVFRAQEQPSLLAGLLLDEAEAVLAAGLFEVTGQHLDEALPQLRRQHLTADLAEAELLRAAAALMADDLVVARRMARAAHRHLTARGDRRAAVATLMMARADARQALRAGGRVTSALLARIETLANQLDTLRLSDEATAARLLIVRLEAKRGNADQASSRLAQLPKPGRYAPVDRRMLWWLCRAEVAMAQGERKAVLTQAKSGLAELARACERLGGLEWFAGMGAHGVELGELAIRVAVDESDTPASSRRLFTWLERTRAQAYRYEFDTSTGDPQQRQQIQEARKLHRDLVCAGLHGMPTNELRAAFEASEREAMRLGLSTTAGARARPLATSDEVAAQLGDRALVQFAYTGQQLLAVVVTASQVRIVRMGDGRDALESAQKLHFDLNALAPDHLPAPLVQVIGASARKQAAQLDELLMRPLSSLIGDKHLIIVPTGALHAVPWGALASCTGRPTVVAPSATAWLAASRAGRDPHGDVVLVNGPGLSFAPGEIHRLAGIYPGARVIDPTESTVSNVLEALEGAQLAHLAAHGEHEARNPMFSHLELTDGPLFAQELSQLRLPPRHVVLAATDLALNRIYPGGEPLGFAGALLARGTHTVIAAVAKVGDEAATGMMEDYHRHIAAGDSPATALVAAIAKDPFRRPFLCLGSG